MKVFTYTEYGTRPCLKGEVNAYIGPRPKIVQCFCIPLFQTPGINPPHLTKERYYLGRRPTPGLDFHIFVP